LSWIKEGLTFFKKEGGWVYECRFKKKKTRCRVGKGKKSRRNGNELPDLGEKGQETDYGQGTLWSHSRGRRAMPKRGAAWDAGMAGLLQRRENRVQQKKSGRACPRWGKNLGNGKKRTTGTGGNKFPVRDTKRAQENFDPRRDPLEYQGHAKGGRFLLKGKHGRTGQTSGRKGPVQGDLGNGKSFRKKFR